MNCYPGLSWCQEINDKVLWFVGILRGEQLFVPCCSNAIQNLYIFAALFNR
jgi:hypothetical protein